jgi:5-methylcytosine-specific restriction endonuclease McrA
VKTTPAKLAQIMAWRKAHPENVRRASRKWHRKNRKYNRDRMRKWRAENRERSLATGRRSHLNRIDQRRADARARVPKWRKENPEAYALQGELRRVRTLNAPGDGITRDQWLDKLAEFGGRCAYCGRVRKLSMDHIDPVSKGGAHDIDNAAPACRSCNSRKHDKSLLLWLATDGKVAA